MKTITFLASGTRGDIQPILALALGLKNAGKRVKIVAPLAFGEWITSKGLAYAPLDGNPSDLMTGPGSQSALTFDRNPLRSLRASLNFIRQARPLYARMLSSGTTACQDSSALVIGLPTTWGTHLAESMKIPCFGAFLQPVTPTAAFPSPLLPTTLSLGAGYNRASYRIAAWATWFPWRGQINAWRKKMGLRTLFFCDFLTHLDFFFYGFSPLLVPPPVDWPSNILAAGSWTLPEETPRHFTELEQFIQGGRPPFYIGFGSPGVRNPDETVKLVVDAAQQVGIRVVFSLPTGATAQKFPASIHPLISPVPHEWLFPQMAGLVHHGGAGTASAGLLAGVPALACPLAVDQFFWAKRLQALGVSPKTIPQRELTARGLAEGLSQLQDQDKKAKARDLGEKMQAEKGLEATIEQMLKLI